MRFELVMNVIHAKSQSRKVVVILPSMLLCLRGFAASRELNRSLGFFPSRGQSPISNREVRP